MTEANAILGATVKDRVTGFKGVATAYCIYLTGCNRVSVTPPVDTDGKTREGEWFDVQRLDIDPNHPVIHLDNGHTPGFDKPPTARANPPMHGRR
jgi:hypothetical protein